MDPESDVSEGEDVDNLESDSDYDPLELSGSARKYVTYVTAPEEQLPEDEEKFLVFSSQLKQLFRSVLPVKS